MMMNRRRFLTISAAFAASPATAHTHSWQGWAFGAEVSLQFRGPRAQAKAALAKARHLIVQTEALFSLYDPNSALVALNTTGQLRAPDPAFHYLMQAADHAHTMTNGLFDPTVQPLWAAQASGAAMDDAFRHVGWSRVRFDADHIQLGQGQALTFNGIAQGYATDRVTDMLAALGLSETLVNIGEYRGVGGPWTIGLQDPHHGHLGHRTLTTGAVATSSPAATQVGERSHIMHPNAMPRWSTVTVEAPTATLADSLSTALVLATRDQIEDIRKRAQTTRITLVDHDGNLTTL